jgi:osmotically-inducible protein OsmY
MIDPTPATVMPENAEDRRIRRELKLALEREHDLPDGVNFVVTNGDVNVTGVVRTESDRKKVNDLALGIVGVKSVANALRVSP